MSTFHQGKQECRFCPHFRNRSLDPEADDFFECNKNHWPSGSDEKRYSDIAQMCPDFKWYKMLERPQGEERCPQCGGESEETIRETEHETTTRETGTTVTYRCRDCSHQWIRRWWEKEDKEETDSPRDKLDGDKAQEDADHPDCPYCSRASSRKCEKCDTYFCNDCIDDHDCSVHRD